MAQIDYNSFILATDISTTGADIGPLAESFGTVPAADANHWSVDTP